MGTATTLEREVKLSFDSAESAREAVLAAGATPLHGRRLQEDALLDDRRQRAARARVRAAHPDGERQEPDHLQGADPGRRR